MRKITHSALISASLLAFAALGTGFASAKETPIGPPVLKDGLEVTAVYLQPIEMDPPDMMRAAAQSDIHLEADIRAAKDNRKRVRRGRLAALPRRELRTDEAGGRGRHGSEGERLADADGRQ